MIFSLCDCILHKNTAQKRKGGNNIAAPNIMSCFRFNSGSGLRARSIRSQNAVHSPCDILLESMPGNVRSMTEEMPSCLKSILQLMMVVLEDVL